MYVHLWEFVRSRCNVSIGPLPALDSIFQCLRVDEITFGNLGEYVKQFKLWIVHESFMDDNWDAVDFRDYYDASVELRNGLMRFVADDEDHLQDLMFQFSDENRAYLTEPLTLHEHQLDLFFDTFNVRWLRKLFVEGEGSFVQCDDFAPIAQLLITTVDLLSAVERRLILSQILSVPAQYDGLFGILPILYSYTRHAPRVFQDVISVLFTHMCGGIDLVPHRDDIIWTPFLCKNVNQDDLTMLVAQGTVIGRSLGVWLEALPTNTTTWNTTDLTPTPSNCKEAMEIIIELSSDALFDPEMLNGIILMMEKGMDDPHFLVSSIVFALCEQRQDWNFDEAVTRSWIEGLKKLSPLIQQTMDCWRRRVRRSHSPNDTVKDEREPPQSNHVDDTSAPS